MAPHTNQSTDPERAVVFDRLARVEIGRTGGRVATCGHLSIVADAGVSHQLYGTD